MMITSVDHMRHWSSKARSEGKIIGLVPTMGYLHDGHCSLISAAARECDVVVTTVFVNPLQFGRGEDFDRYPRDIERDTALALAAGTTVLFAPPLNEMYPSGFATTINPGPIADKFEGEYRPGHFAGVATVVAKLFNITTPHHAYFGQKDYQQTLVIAQLIRDLNFSVQLHVLPTVREADGLAMSSRNVYLSPDERRRAPILYRALQAAQEVILNGERSRVRINACLQRTIESIEGVTIDYARAACADSLEEPDTFDSGDDVVLLLAVRIGTTRLIDNALIRVP